MRKLIAVMMACAALMLCLAGCSNEFDEDSSNLIEESKQNVAPYLEKLDSPLSDDGKILLASELYDNKDNINFMGMTWMIDYDSAGGVVNEAMLGSNDFFTYEEHEAFVSELSRYFGSEPVVERSHVGEYNDNVYYWTDESIPCTVKFYTSVRANHEDDEDRFELYWVLDESIPE